MPNLNFAEALITFSNTLGQERVRYYWDYFLQTQR